MVEIELAVVKMTMSKLEADSAPYVDTVQSCRRNSETEKGSLPVWPFDVSTMRFLGEAKKRVEAGVPHVVEPAPTLFNAAWGV